MMHVTFEDDEFYKRKYNIKPFSIKVDKMSEKDIEDCIQQHKSPERGFTNGLLSWATSYRRRSVQLTEPSTTTTASRSPLPVEKDTGEKCDCDCNDPKDEYYKELFDIQECEILLPRVTKDATNKKGKLAFVFDYFTFCFVLKICFSIIVAVFVLYFL